MSTLDDILERADEVHFARIHHDADPADLEVSTYAFALRFNADGRSAAIGVAEDADGAINQLAAEVVDKGWEPI